MRISAASKLATLFVCAGSILGGAAIAASADKPAKPAPAKPAAAKTVPDPKAQSAGFWDDWHTIRQGDDWQRLQQSIGLADKSKATAAQGAEQQRQGVMSVTLDTPEQTSKFINDAASVSGDTGSAGAISTVLSMRASPAMVKEAEPLVAPEAQAQAQTWQADLSNGIAGLPGIYLSDSPISRPPEPAGYEPVSGGSLGCPSQ